jgi:uncharacterized protein YyaL (SSP411 family)
MLLESTYPRYAKTKVVWLGVVSLLLGRHAVSGEAAQPIEWHSWSEDTFTQAAHEHRFVLLNLGSAWCPTCRRMDQQAYGDPTVHELIARRYLGVRADRSARPDLNNRYPGYDQPATIFFDTDGNEIVRLQGYRSAEQMATILQAIIDDPSPGPSAVREAAVQYSATPTFSPDLLATLHKELESQYEAPEQFSAFAVRYLDADFVEYAGLSEDANQRSAELRAQQALLSARMLIDPVWGGIYQSEVLASRSPGNEGFTRFGRLQVGRALDDPSGSWNEPHPEKPLYVQAQAIQLFARASVRWRAPQYLVVAQNINHYVRAFLTSPEGAFYVGQEAAPPDGIGGNEYFALADELRRAHGVPPVDQHLYARENGWMISALCALYAASGDRAILQQAVHAAEWVIANRSLPEGGFSHAGDDPGGPYLGDSLAVAEGFLALHKVTGDHLWLQRAQSAAHFIATHFGSLAAAGFVTSPVRPTPAYQPHPDREENVRLARFASHLGQYTGDPEDQHMAVQALRYLATSGIATADFSAPALLAQRELTHPARYLVTVGDKSDPAAQALFQAAVRAEFAYSRIEWWDRGEAASKGVVIGGGDRSRAAAFICDPSHCGEPIFNPGELTVAALRL